MQGEVPENIHIPRFCPGRAMKILRVEGVEACYRGLFPGVLSEIGELSIINKNYIDDYRK